MKELDFLPSRLPRTADRRLWRLGTMVAVAALIAILGGLHALRPVRISSAQTDGRGAAGGDAAKEPRCVTWVLPTSRTTQDQQLDALLLATFGAESESLFIETFRARYATTAIEMRLHPDAGSAQPAEGPIANLLGPEDGRLLSAELMGFAATDLEIGMLVGRLSVCPFTSDVRLVEASEARFNDRRMRAFRIGLEIGQNRE